jgi:hypothetical protein
MIRTSCCRHDECVCCIALKRVLLVGTCLLQFQYVSLLSMELHVHTRGKLRPDPDLDPVCAIFYALHSDIPPDGGEREFSGVFLTAAADGGNSSNCAPPQQSPGFRGDVLRKCGLPGVNATYVANEEELIREFCSAVVK